MEGVETALERLERLLNVDETKQQAAQKTPPKDPIPGGSPVLARLSPTPTKELPPISLPNLAHLPSLYGQAHVADGAEGWMSGTWLVGTGAASHADQPHPVQAPAAERRPAPASHGYGTVAAGPFYGAQAGAEAGVQGRPAVLPETRAREALAAVRKALGPPLKDEERRMLAGQNPVSWLNHICQVRNLCPDYASKVAVGGVETTLTLGRVSGRGPRHTVSAFAATKKAGKAATAAKILRDFYGCHLDGQSAHRPVGLSRKAKNLRNQKIRKAQSFADRFAQQGHVLDDQRAEALDFAEDISLDDDETFGPLHFGLPASASVPTGLARHTPQAAEVTPERPIQPLLPPTTVSRPLRPTSLPRL